MYLSVVIPAYNAGAVLGAVVLELVSALESHCRLEIVVVNDGSQDNTDRVAREIVSAHPGVVRYLRLERNVGEHSAVMAGLCDVRGERAAIVDDDGQNPPEAIIRLAIASEENGWDATYARYKNYRQPILRRWMSRLHNGIAGLFLGKPDGFYLSSFKVLSRSLIEKLRIRQVPSPYLDALILSETRKFGSVAVDHRASRHGRSRYTGATLIRLWVNSLSFAPPGLLLLLSWSGALLSLAGFAAAWRTRGPNAIPFLFAAAAGVFLFLAGRGARQTFRRNEQERGRPAWVVVERLDAPTNAPRSEMKTHG